MILRRADRVHIGDLLHVDPSDAQLYRRVVAVRLLTEDRVEIRLDRVLPSSSPSELRCVLWLLPDDLVEVYL